MAKRPLPDILTDAEEKALLDVFDIRWPTPRRNRTMILLALRTGMRVSELVNLKWEDIDQTSGRLHLKRGKGERDRVLWLSPILLDELAETTSNLGRERRGLVFPTRDGDLIKPPYLRAMIAKYAKKASIQKRVHFHLLRHTYLTKLYARTHDIRVTQQVAGHADISTTQIYTHVSGEDIRRAMLWEP
jgi:integrase/recombinase XerD